MEGFSTASDILWRAEELSGRAALFQPETWTDDQGRNFTPAVTWKGKLLSRQEACRVVVDFHERAIALGSPWASQSLAKLFQKGHCDGGSDQRVASLFLTAAEAGLFDSMMGYADILIDGKGAPRDWAVAFEWLLKAAAHPTETLQSLAEPAYRVADFLEHGYGVIKVDLAAAYGYYLFAAAQGHEKAREAGDRLEEALEPSQRAAGQAIARRKAEAPETDGTASPQPRKRAGTGFFVNSNGVLVTNFHVAGGCSRVTITDSGEVAKPIAEDRFNDLIALRVSGGGHEHAKLADRASIAQGDPVFVFGFPLGEILSTTGNLTSGNIAALSGLGNDSRMMQISAPVQPGNSGGPVVGEDGAVVGVVTSKANVLRIAQVTGDIAQNVNFALTLGTLIQFLDLHRIDHVRMPWWSFSKSSSDIAELARSFTVPIECTVSP